MDRFQALTAFARVVETGSFARAAERLGVSVSSVSRLVADLEAHLDVRLLNRTTRRLSLTESGQAFFERCVQLLADLEEAEVAVTAASIVPRGTLRLTCSATFGARHLAPAIAAFAARHPQMRFDVELSERVVDLVEEGFDLAVRVGETGSQNLVGRRIGTTRLVCCAAPSYLARHGEPLEPGDLTRHTCLTYEYAANRNVWSFRDGKGAERQIRIEGPVHASNGRFNVALAAELCDGWLPLFFSPKDDGWYRARLAEGFAASGDPTKSLRFEVASMLTIIPGDDVEQCADLMRPFVALYAGGMGAKDVNFHFDVFARMGWEEVATKVQALYLEGRKQEAAALIPVEMVEDIALIGPVDKIRDDVARWKETCLTTVLLNGQAGQLAMLADLING